MSKVVVATVLASMIIIPAAGAGYMLNSKYKKFENDLTQIVSEINSSGGASAQVNFNRGLFNSTGNASITFNDSFKTKININFTARHGVEIIFNNPIIINTSGQIQSEQLKSNNASFSTKTRYYFYYSDTEYTLNNIVFPGENGSEYDLRDLSGNAKYTYESKDIENYSKLKMLVIKNNGAVQKVAKDITFENKVKSNNLFVGTTFIKVEKLDTAFNNMSNITLDYNTEVGVNPQLYNIDFKLKGDFYNKTAGKSTFSNKLTFYSIPLSNIDGISGSIIKSNLFKDQNSISSVANSIVKTINDGFEVDSQNEINTQNIGNYFLTLSANFKKAEKSKAVADNLVLKGLFKHKGPYINYMYDLSDKLNIAMFKKKEDIFMIDFSFQERRGFINSTEIEPVKYLQIITDIIKQI